MPIYEYECTACGRIEEVLQKVSDRPLVKCSQCAGKMHKLISQSSFHLKGTGWYVTDYAKPPRGSSAAVKPKTETPPTTETKPATSSSNAGATGPDSSGN
jgi:putative FmdB family regulatory protein